MLLKKNKKYNNKILLLYMLLNHKDIVAISILSFIIVGIFIYKENKHIQNLITIIFKNNKYLGTIFYLIVGTILTMFFLPITPFNALALYLYPTPIAFLITLIMHLISASVEFFISRHYTPTFIKSKLDEVDLLKKLMTMKGLSPSKWLELSTLTRASPNFPYALVSYMWGMTEIPYYYFILGTFFGCLPYLFMELFMLKSAGKIITGEDPWHQIMMIGVTLFLSFALGKYIEHVIKKV